MLGDVESTGLLTAVCHAIESRSRRPLLRDPRAEAIADRLAPALAASRSRLLRRLARGAIPGSLVVHIAIRARTYDRLAREFAARHPGACVVNLGCGLDTRFWRIDDGRLRQYDLDLPEVIALKRRLVDETDRYHLVGMSVLDHRWMDLVAKEAGPFLFLAEGLMMYLPPEGVRALVVGLHARFPGGELVLEVVNSVWLSPWLRWIVALKMERQLDLGRGTKYRSGIRDGHEPETWSPGLRLLGEWSYFDEDEPRIGPLRILRHVPLFRTTQWTVRYLLGEAPGPALSPRRG